MTSSLVVESDYIFTFFKNSSPLSFPLNVGRIDLKLRTSYTIRCDSLYTVLTFYGVLFILVSEKGVLVYACAD